MGVPPYTSMHLIQEAMGGSLVVLDSGRAVANPPLRLAWGFLVPKW